MTPVNLLLYGQPGSGKTTLANILARSIYKTIVLDGDKIREATGNKDYTNEGRMRNLKDAIAMARTLNEQGYNTVLAMVAPYEKMRVKLKDALPNVHLAHLHYDRAKQVRGRENYWSADFFYKEHDFSLDTGSIPIGQCVNHLLHWLKPKASATRVVKLRYNNKHTGKLKWRLLVDGKETLVDNVFISGFAHTSEDVLEDQQLKHHVTMNAIDIQIVDTTAMIVTT